MTARQKSAYPCGSRMDALAELLSQSLLLADAAIELGITYSQANACFQRMKKRLGAEQCV